MKPLDGTFAQNAEKWGVAGLWIDGGRIPTDDSLGGGEEKAKNIAKNQHTGWDRPWHHDDEKREQHAANIRAHVEKAEALGRWPANVIHDGSDEVVSVFPITESGTGANIGGKRRRVVKRTSSKDDQGNQGAAFGAESRPAGTEMITYGDKGSAARFFYCAKASISERGKDNKHPTVKPIALCRYLVRLVSMPTMGIVLDPFCGSGSILIAAKLEGQDFIGIDQEEEYVELSKKRLAECDRGSAAHPPEKTPTQAVDVPTDEKKTHYTLFD